MKIHDLTLRNFRKYETARFRFHPNFTILIGENGAGKTTILDAVAILLATYFQGSGIVIGKSTVGKDDRRLVIHEKAGQVFVESQKEVYLSASGELHGQKLAWRRDAGDRGGRAKNLVAEGAADRERLENGENPDFPILAYYGSGRLWARHRNISTGKPKSQLDAYRHCLDPKSDQKAFQNWYKKLTLSAIQRQRRAPALSVVQSVVTNCIPDASDFFHDIDVDQPIIRFDNGGLMLFDQLSDGYRNMIAMAADIAHRLSRLNPHMELEAAEKSTGIVLIDEIDLHLHPRWQRSVVSDLQNAFPNLQFIATTHSPFIIQSMASGAIIDLNREPNAGGLPEMSGIASPGVVAEYENRSIEDIAEDIMGVELPQRSRRYQRMYDAAKEYYSVLKAAERADDAEIERLKHRLDELSAPFSDNIAYHAFLEMERIAAGLGSSRQSGES